MLNSQLYGVPVPLLLALLVAVALTYFVFFKTSFPKSAPRFVGTEVPLFGSPGFFTRRWDWYKAHSSGGSFSFWAGSYPVIALSGYHGRKVFFESRELDLGEGYRALLGGQVANNTNSNIEFDYFSRRLMAMLKGDRLKKGLPQLIGDIRSAFDKLATAPVPITDPFESIYRLVFQLNMRTVACQEIAEDPALVTKVLKAFETIERAGDNMTSICYPRLPTISNIKRTIAGARVFMMLDGFVKDRKKTGRREEDALQFLMDHDDDPRNMIEFVFGALFAGQLNTGINAAWMVLYLSKFPEWRDKVRAEVEAVAARYAVDASAPLKDKLMHVPIDAWESSFSTIDMGLKDAIRISMVGTAFRRNWHAGGSSIPINKGIEGSIPYGAYALYNINEVHFDPSIYPEPNKWDPDRYATERAEDKKTEYGWLGWGVARHPCLGMRFAKLEVILTTAFWVAYFDSEPCDKDGKPTEQWPQVDLNAHTAHKPSPRVYVEYAAGEQSVAP